MPPFGQLLRAAIACLKKLLLPSPSGESQPASTQKSTLSAEAWGATRLHNPAPPNQML